MFKNLRGGWVGVREIHCRVVALCCVCVGCAVAYCLHFSGWPLVMWCHAGGRLCCTGNKPLLDCWLDTVWMAREANLLLGLVWDFLENFFIKIQTWLSHHHCLISADVEMSTPLQFSWMQAQFLVFEMIHIGVYSHRKCFQVFLISAAWGLSHSVTLLRIPRLSLLITIS